MNGILETNNIIAMTISASLEFLNSVERSVDTKPIITEYVSKNIIIVIAHNNVENIVIITTP